MPPTLTSVGSVVMVTLVFLFSFFQLHALQVIMKFFFSDYRNGSSHLSDISQLRDIVMVPCFRPSFGEKEMTQTTTRPHIAQFSAELQ